MIRMLNRKKKVLDDVTVLFEVSKIHFYLSDFGSGPLVYKKCDSSVKFSEIWICFGFKGIKAVNSGLRFGFSFTPCFI